MEQSLLIYSIKWNGTATSTFKEKAVSDPKGLMNKTTQETKRTVTTDAQGNVIGDKLDKSIDAKPVK